MKRTPLRRQSKDPRATLKRKAWDTFSLWIRNRDNWTCFTCGVRRERGTGLMQAGHFIHTDSLDFNEKNINAQCANCNKELRGNIKLYGMKLEAKYGQGIIEELKKLGNTYRQFTLRDYELVIEKYS